MDRFQLKKFPKFLLLFAIMTFSSRIFFMTGIFIPFYLEWGQISMQHVMFLQSWFMFWLFIFEVPSGTMADYVGRKFTLMLTFFILIGAIVAYSSIPNFFMFLVAEFLWALAMAMLSGTFQAFIYESLQEHEMDHYSKPIFSAIQSIMLLANLFSTLLGGLIAEWSGPQYAMRYSAIPIVISLFLTFFLKEPHAMQKTQNDGYIEPDHQNKKQKIQFRSKKSYRQIFKDGIGTFRNSQSLRILAFEAIAFQIIGYYLRWFYQAKLLLLNVNMAWMAVIHTIIMGLQIIIMNVLPFIERKYGKKRVFLRLSPIILGLAYFFATSKHIWIVSIASIFGIAFNHARIPVLDSYMNKFIDSEERATVISLISMMRQFFLIFLNLFMGYIGDNYLDYMFIILGIVTFVTMFFSQIEEKHLLD